MSVTILRKKFGLVSVAETWYNTEPSFEKLPHAAIHILMCSGPLIDFGTAQCLEEATRRTNMIDLTRPEEELWKEMDPKSCRYEIRKIKKLVDGGESVRIQNDTPVEEFIRIANRFLPKRWKERSLLQSQDLLKYMEQGCGDLITIYYKNKLIGGNFYVKDNHRVRLLHSFNDRLSDKSMQKLSGPLMRYLHWQVMMHTYKPQGIRWYDMGGVSLDKNAPTYGIAKFKLSFGGTMTEDRFYVLARNRWIGGLFKLYQWLQRGK